MNQELVQDIKHFTHLEAWKVNHQAALAIYHVTKHLPKEERFGLIDQLRRAATSITANIAEGWGHFHYANKIRYYYQARGSNCEVQNFLIIAHDLEFLTDDEFNEIKNIVYSGYKLINGLIRSNEKKK